MPSASVPALMVFTTALFATAAEAQPTAVETSALSAPWRAGSPDCAANPQPPLEVRAAGTATYVLRENPCATWEAPFMYLLVGKTRALLIDTGDIADPTKAPVAATVLGLLPEPAGVRLPLLVAHTHRHLDHRAGDAQFAGRPGVQVVGYDLRSVQRFYGFDRWPEGQARIDLGGRTVDVIPTPGHNVTHVAFYDEATGQFFSGDFLMPGRLLIDDAAADRASAARAAAFLRDRSVTAVLGGHIELRADGRTEPWQSHWHPDEHALPMTKADIDALPAALERFNGVYTRSGPFIMMNTQRILEIAGGSPASCSSPSWPALCWRPGDGFGAGVARPLGPEVQPDRNHSRCGVRATSARPRWRRNFSSPTGGRTGEAGDGGSSRTPYSAGAPFVPSGHSPKGGREC